MIGALPKTLNVNGNELEIRTDYRTILVIFQAFEDPDMKPYEKNIAMLECLYIEPIQDSDIDEALKQANWFIDCGDNYEAKGNKKLMDWEQDQNMIFSAINKVAGCETRAIKYIHWWTFMSYFNELGEGLFSTVINIRRKKSKGKKLDKSEQEFYAENKKLIDIKAKYTEDEEEEVKKLKELLGMR